MTEDEAKTKWCPLIRFTDETENTYAVTNRGDVCDRTRNQEARDLSRCIGFACMAWREAEIVTRPDPYTTVKTPGGYCGLAGTP